VTVINRQRRRRVDVSRLKGLIAALRATLGGLRGDVVLVLAGDAFVRRLNRTYRRRDAPTDVLAFPGAGGRGCLGDIVISVETAGRQARAAGWPLEKELEVLTLHGLLHLLGYDHERDGGRMRRLERRMRRTLRLGGARVVRRRMRAA
jgi:probable rRNA maturation factor